MECQVQGEVWLRVYDFAPLGGLHLSLILFFLTMSNFFFYGPNILTGTKMEAVAYGDQTMRFDRLLRVGECYDFMRVGFVPTYVGPLGYIFR